MFLMIPLGVLCLFLNTFLSWWILFVVFRMLGVMKMKQARTPSLGIAVYVVIQEVCGALFIYGFREEMQLFLLLIKGGFAPFYFWVPMVVNNSYGSGGYSWIVSWQKYPYFLILRTCLIEWMLVWVLIAGLFPLFHGIFSYRIRFIYLMWLTSSGNNMLVLGVCYTEKIWWVIIYYRFLAFNIPVYISPSGVILIGEETFYIIGGFPGGVPFYLKLLVIRILAPMGGLMLLLVLVGAMLNIFMGVNLLNSSHWVTRKIHPNPKIEVPYFSWILLFIYLN